MPKNERKQVFKRARKLGVRTFHFYRGMEKIFAAADLVVCMGGYNTLCETLSQGTVSLIIPRVNPRKEQLIRAKAFHDHHLVDYIPWNTLSPQIMGKKVFELLESPASLNRAISGFKLTGIETMGQRLQAFRCGRI